MSSDFETSRSVLEAGADAFGSKVDEPGWLLKKLHQYAIQGNSSYVSLQTDWTKSANWAIVAWVNR
jgi:hypothetical protein